MKDISKIKVYNVNNVKFNANNVNMKEIIAQVIYIYNILFFFLIFYINLFKYLLF